MRHHHFCNILVFSILVLSASAQAEVLNAAPNGFTVRHEVAIESDRFTVFESAVGSVGQWWSSDHTVSGDAANMSMTTTVPGCFCETLGPGAGLVHMTVSFVNPGVMIRLTGGLGPLGLMGVSGNMTWEFEEAESGTIVVLQYAVGGYMDGGLDTVAPAVDGVLGEAMNRLKSYVESGDPEQG